MNKNKNLGREELVCKILKSLCSLKQAGWLCNKTIIEFFQKISFIPINADPCILVLIQNNGLIIVGVNVDDLILESKSSDELGWLKDQLLKEFSMKDLGEAKTIIGWEITRDFKAGILKSDLKSYIQNSWNPGEWLYAIQRFLPWKPDHLFS